MKISLFYEGLPPQDLSEARRGNELFCIFLSPIRRGGVPSGAAAFIVTGNIEVQTLTSYLDFPIFMVSGVNV